jgi:hypothetical protein
MGGFASNLSQGGARLRVILPTDLRIPKFAMTFSQ